MSHPESPRAGRPAIVSPDDQRVTWVELFFGLVFVFGVTQVASIFHGHIDLATAGTALFALSVLHSPMLCGIVGIAAGHEVALAAPAAPLPMAARVALGAGTVLFVCGTAVAVVRATGDVMRWRWRWLLAPAGAVAAIALASRPWVTLSILVVALVATAVAEHAAVGATPSMHASLEEPLS